MLITFGIGQSPLCWVLLPSIFPAIEGWLTTSSLRCLVRPGLTALGLLPGSSFRGETCPSSLHRYSMYLTQWADSHAWILFAGVSQFAPGSKRQHLGTRGLSPESDSARVFTQ